MSHPMIVEDISAPIAAELEAMFNSGSSEQYAVADCLNTIAENGEDQATDEHLVACAEEIRNAAQRVISVINPEITMSPETAAAMDSMGELDIFDRLVYHAEQAAQQLDAVAEQGRESARAYAGNLRRAINAVKFHLQNNVSNRGGKLELHTFRDRQLTMVERCYKEAAGGKDGELEFDDPLVVSESDDGGAYVLGWAWVSAEDVTLPEPFSCNLIAAAENGKGNIIATDTFLAADKDHARELMIEKHWDERLTAGSFTPRVTFNNPDIPTFKFKLVGDDDDDEITLEPIEVKARTREEAIEILNMIRPTAEVEEDVDDDESDDES